MPKAVMALGRAFQAVARGPTVRKASSIFIPFNFFESGRSPVEYKFVSTTTLPQGKRKEMPKEN